ncbi:MAG: biotin transporter BioY [Proteobacteria bacterium]|nr:biotin transporter BioY [Pseudomonadota bacterium]
MESNTPQLKQSLFIALFAALISAGAFIAIPIGPVPIVLQNMFVLMAGLVLGPRAGIACVGLYLLAGALGLPVFSGGTGGLGKFAGPTGGYLLGYLPAVFIVGLISNIGKESGEHRLLMDMAAGLAGSLLVYACGVPWLKYVFGIGWEKAFMLGMVPFIFGDLLKILAAPFLVTSLRPLISTKIVPTTKQTEDECN